MTRIVGLLLIFAMIRHDVCRADAAGPLLHPVITGVERLGPDAAPEAGLILLGELNCTACHDPGPRAETISIKPAPDLSAVGTRIRPDYLERFIADPAHVKPGTTMPQVMGRLDSANRERTAHAIAQFLRSLTKTFPEAGAAEEDSIRRGEQLFHTVGCVACHAPRDAKATEKPLPHAVPLGRLQDKYTHKSLAAFLENPLAVRAGGRMPNMQLSPWEAIDLAAFLLQGAPPLATIPVDGSLVAEGRTAFTQLGCANCHHLEGISSEQTAMPLAGLNMAGGCLADDPGGAPDFGLSEAQRGAIRAALAAAPVPPSPADHIRRVLITFNCIACHARGDLGGIEADRSAYFHSDNENLGEQGRIPPPLSGVGAKLNADWLRRVLVEGKSVRPYMLTRMPIFGRDNVEDLADLFAEVDVPDGPKFVEHAKPDEHDTMKKVGWELVGNKGFSCIACHRFQGEMPQTMAALDLSDAPARLRYSWFHAYLLKPQQFSPTTVMPAFWPNGVSTRPELLMGDTDRQIDAIWEYLIEGTNARLPQGLKNEPLVLQVGDEAVMLRRKYRDVGKRGIGVGYPAGINLVFDSESMRLTEIWKGDFVDAGAVWRNQGSGDVHLLGQDHVTLPGDTCFALLGSIADDWPTTTSRERDIRFKGYRLDDKRRPTFLYRIGDIAVEDDPMDVKDAATGNALFRRTLTFTVTGAEKLLVMRLAAGKEITADSAGSYIIGPLRLNIAGQSAAQIVRVGDKQELRAAMQLHTGANTLKIEYRW